MRVQRRTRSCAHHIPRTRVCQLLCFLQLREKRISASEFAHIARVVNMLSMAEEEDEDESTAKGPHGAVSLGRRGDSDKGGDDGAATTGAMTGMGGDTGRHGSNIINEEDSESDSDGAGSDDGSDQDNDDGYTNTTAGSSTGSGKTCDNVTALTDRERQEEETHSTSTSSARDLSPRSNHPHSLVLASDDAATAVAIADRVLGLTQPVAYVELGGARGLGSVEPPPINESSSGEPTSPPHHQKTPLRGSSNPHISAADANTNSDDGEARSMDNDLSRPTSTGTTAITSSGLGSSSGIYVERSDGVTTNTNAPNLSESPRINSHEVQGVDVNNDTTATSSSTASAVAAPVAPAPPPEPRVESPGAPRPLSPIAKRMLRDGFITKGE